MNVHDQDGFPSVSRFGKGIQISEVQSGVPLGKAEVRARIMMRHRFVLLLQVCFGRAELERGRTGRGDGMILIAGTTADADRPDYLALAFQRDAASEDHDLAIV